MADMKAGAGDADVVLAEEAGLRGDFTEAEAWAFLAIRSRRGLPLTWSTTTGCRAPATGGVLAEP
jgi:anhydro-N-acetylmuramic acid kinase